MIDFGRILRKFLSPKMKETILRSVPYRLYSRSTIKNRICFSVEITTKCNLSCDMCTRKDLVTDGKINVGDMDDELIGKFLEEMERFYWAGLPVYYNPMGMGEPLLCEKGFEIFKKVKNIAEEIPTVLVTNAITMNEEACEKIIDAKVDEVTVSLNANDAETYKKHMGTDKYETVLENTKRLIKIRNEKGLDTPRVFVQYIAYDGDMEKFKDDIEAWAKVMGKYDKCFVHPIVNQAGLTKTNLKSEKRYPCTQPLWRVAIRINGDIYPCDPCFYAGSERIESLYLGNIREDSPFDMYMDRHSKAKMIVENMRRNDYALLPKCEECNNYSLNTNIYFNLPIISGIKKKKWL